MKASLIPIMYTHTFINILSFKVLQKYYGIIYMIMIPSVGPAMVRERKLIHYVIRELIKSGAWSG